VTIEKGELATFRQRKKERKRKEKKSKNKIHGPCWE